MKKRLYPRTKEASCQPTPNWRKIPFKEETSTVMTLILATTLLSSLMALFSSLQGPPLQAATLAEELNNPQLAEGIFWATGISPEDQITEEELAQIWLLDLRYYGLEDLTGIEKFTGLQILYLDNNNLSQLPGDGLRSLTQLQLLTLRNNQLQEVPLGLLEHSSLKELDLANNQLQELGDCRALTALRTLHLEHNLLTKLPEGLGSLPSLGYLYLHENNLCSFGEGQMNSLSLERLTLHYNRLAYLDSSLHNRLSLSLAPSAYSLYHQRQVYSLGSFPLGESLSFLCPSLFLQREEYLESTRLVWSLTNPVGEVLVFPEGVGGEGSSFLLDGGFLLLPGDYRLMATVEGGEYIMDFVYVWDFSLQGGGLGEDAEVISEGVPVPEHLDSMDSGVTLPRSGSILGLVGVSCLVLGGFCILGFLFYKARQNQLTL